MDKFLSNYYLIFIISSHKIIHLANYEKIFYTGPIDQFFDFKYSVSEHLEYRSLKFVWETHDKEFYQDHSVVNYPNDHAYTRIVEYKHFTKQKHPKTTISKEYSVDYEPGVNEPYYPVPNPRNQAIYEKYRKAAEKLKNIYFVGRLANYKYFNMDQAFKAALDLFYSLEGYQPKYPVFEQQSLLGMDVASISYDSSKRK